MEKQRLSFSSDYLEGMHPAILKELVETNMLQTSGYGTDWICERAKEKIRKACDCPEAEIYFLSGGTQTNAVVIKSCLRPWQGVIAADTGHVACHEAGAIEAGAHKVMTVPGYLGKLKADDVRKAAEAYANDENREHMVMPGMVYISQPTEYGTLYTKEELLQLKAICGQYGMVLYVDGARLAYALGCPENDVTLKDLAGICDVFYIGGTKCGAMFGEAVVIPQKGLIPHFFTLIKQNGALLAKGRILGIQFDALFTDNLYLTIGKEAVYLAQKIQSALKANGFDLLFESPSNQIFAVLEDDKKKKMDAFIETGFWEKQRDRTVIRFATSWATKPENVEYLISVLRDFIDK